MATSPWTKSDSPIVRMCRESGKPLALPEEGGVEFVDWGVPLKAAAADPALGDADPNRGVERVDLVGVTPDGRLALGFTKYLEPDAARAGTGDTPLRYLLEALAHTAIVEASREAIGAELSAIITFIAFEAAYFSEIVRAGIQSIPRGQVNAGYALGMSNARVALTQLRRQRRGNRCRAAEGDLHLAGLVGFSHGYAFSARFRSARALRSAFRSS